MTKKLEKQITSVVRATPPKSDKPKSDKSKSDKSSEPTPTVKPSPHELQMHQLLKLCERDTDFCEDVNVAKAELEEYWGIIKDQRDLLMRDGCLDRLKTASMPNEDVWNDFDELGGVIHTALDELEIARIRLSASDNPSDVALADFIGYSFMKMLPNGMRYRRDVNPTKTQSDAGATMVSIDARPGERPSTKAELEAHIERLWALLETQDAMSSGVVDANPDVPEMAGLMNAEMEHSRCGFISRLSAVGSLAAGVVGAVGGAVGGVRTAIGHIYNRRFASLFRQTIGRPAGALIHMAGGDEWTRKQMNDLRRRDNLFGTDDQYGIVGFFVVSTVVSLGFYYVYPNDIIAGFMELNNTVVGKILGPAGTFVTTAAWEQAYLAAAATGRGGIATLGQLGLIFRETVANVAPNWVSPATDLAQQLAITNALTTAAGNVGLCASYFGVDYADKLSRFLIMLAGDPGDARLTPLLAPQHAAFAIATYQGCCLFRGILHASFDTVSGAVRGSWHSAATVWNVGANMAAITASILRPMKVPVKLPAYDAVQTKRECLLYKRECLLHKLKPAVRSNVGGWVAARMINAPGLYYYANHDQEATCWDPPP